MFGKPNQTKDLEELLLLNEEDLNGINDAFINEDEKTIETHDEDGARKYTIKYNGEYIELPISELIILAQKGMDYDRIRKQRDKMRALLEKKDDSDFLSSENTDSFDNGNPDGEQSNNRIDTTDLIMRAAQLLKKKSGQQTYEPNIAALTAEEKQGYGENDKARFIELFAKNPELSELPDEVYSAIAKGVSPTEAYNAYEKDRLIRKAAELEEQIEALKNNEKNRAKALSSLRDDAPAQSLDDFISGLFG